MTPPGFWASVWNSATSFQFYRHIQDQSFRRSITYVVGLALCLSLLISWRVVHDFSRSLSEWTSWISATLPDIKIENGVSHIGLDQTKTISDGAAILILDPTNSPRSIDEKYRTGMILGRDKMTLKWNQVTGPTGDVSRLEKLIYVCAYAAYLMDPQSFHGNEFDLSGIRSLMINPETIAHWKKSAGRWVSVCLPFVYFVFYLGGKLLQALFFSIVLAYSHRAMRENGMHYARILNVALYALTPSAIFSAVVQTASLQVPYLEWVFLGMYVAFLMGAMNACIPRKLPEQSDLDSDGIDF